MFDGICVMELQNCLKQETSLRILVGFTLSELPYFKVQDFLITYNFLTRRIKHF